MEKYQKQVTDKVWQQKITEKDTEIQSLKMHNASLQTQNVRLNKDLSNILEGYPHAFSQLDANAQTNVGNTLVQHLELDNKLLRDQLSKRINDQDSVLQKAQA